MAQEIVWHRASTRPAQKQWIVAVMMAVMWARWFFSTDKPMKSDESIRFIPIFATNIMEKCVAARISLPTLRFRRRKCRQKKCAVWCCDGSYGSYSWHYLIPTKPRCPAGKLEAAQAGVISVPFQMLWKQHLQGWPRAVRFSCQPALDPLLFRIFRYSKWLKKLVNDWVTRFHHPKCSQENGDESLR